MNTKRNIYSVPDLPTKEIISYFADLNITIAAGDILKPTVAVTSAIFDSILELFEGKSVEDGEESIQVIKQVQRMGTFLNKIGISNFTVRDIAPDSRRLIQILSTIINFGMYRDNKKGVYEQASKMADNNFAIKKNLEKQQDEIKSMIEKAQAGLGENAKTKENLEKEIENLENELKEFYKYQKAKMEEVSLLKSEKIEIGDKLCSCQLLEHNLKQEITCYKTQIVSDPSKLMELIEEMRGLIEKERDAIKALEKTIQERTAALAKYQKSNEQAGKIHLIVKELNEIEENIEKHDQHILLNESKLKNWDSNMNALKIRINHIERQISHLESKIYNLQSRDKKISEEISIKINDLQQKYDSVNNEREVLLEKVRNNNKLIQDVMFEKAKKSGEHERYCAEIAGLLVNFNSDFERYFNELKNAANRQ